jgi:hypothetical protein
MADQTNKFNPDAVILNNAPPQVNWRTPSATIVDGDGKVLAAIPIDPTTNQGTYTRTLTAADLGQQRLSMKFTGSPNYAGGGTDEFTSHIGGNAQGQMPYVTKIVAGPGIYISAPNGQGVVTISTVPIPSTLTTEDLFDITWTVSDPANIPSTGDQSQFTVGGQNGLMLRSRDGVNFVEMPRSFPIGIGNVHSLQSTEFNGSGLVYYHVATYADQGTGAFVQLGSLWGKLANTNSSGVLLGDVMNNKGSYYTLGGNPITGEQDYYTAVIYESGSFNSALYLVYTAEGEIFSVSNGLPFDFYNQDTGEGTANPPELTSEYNDGTTEFEQYATNLVDQSFSNYRVVLAGSHSNGTGKIVYSDRDNNNTSIWTEALTSSAELVAVVYGNGAWIAAGKNDTIYTSTDGASWIETNSNWPGSYWLWGAYGNGKFILVGEHGRAVYSTDNGATWSRAQTNTTNTLNSIAYSPTLNKFVAVGNGRTIVTVNGD